MSDKYDWEKTDKDILDKVNKPKLCWWCRYFNYTNADSGYGEYTPGYSFSIDCCKRIWAFDPYNTSQDEFGKILQTAETCKFFTII